MNLSQVLSTRSIPVFDLGAMLDQLQPDTEVKLNDRTLTIDGVRKALGVAPVVKQRRLLPEERAAIAAAPKETKLSTLAAQFGTSVQSVKKYRKQ